MENCKLTVVNIRGTSGSGKTTIVKNILSKGHFQPIYETPTTGVVSYKIVGYHDDISKWVIVGSYENACGGCDTIRHQIEVEEAIEKYLSYGYNVMFEGLLISTISQRGIDFNKRISNRANTLFVYLTTPIEECIERVKKRRLEAGNTKPFNTENTISRVKAIETTFSKLSSAGCYCIKASQKEIIDNLYKWFGLGGNFHV